MSARRCRGLRAVALVPALLAVPALAQPHPAQAPEGDAHRIERRDRIQLHPGDRKLIALDQLRAIGRGYIGVELLDLTPELRTHFGAPESLGVMVSQVAKDSPAAAAGILVGDIITRAGSQDVGSSLDLARAVRGLGKGDTTDLEVLREGRAQSFRVTVEERSRRAIDIGDGFGWQARGEGEEPRIFFFNQPTDGSSSLPPVEMERLGRHLERLDWDRIAPDPRRAEQLEKRLADLEKRLAELKKQLEDATRDRR